MMMKYLLAGVLFIGVHAQISQYRLQQIHERRLEQEYRNNPANFAEAEPPERWFEQLVDHFDKSNNATFKQKYYVSTEFYKPGGPVYLTTPGEASLSSPRTFKSHLGELANLTHGAMVTVEHRYYGKSLPVPNLKPENMRYLSTRQALADFAHFINTWTVPADLGVTLPKDTRWIFVGGSYPGNVAAWMRLKYPDFVFAAYASSAPVKAKQDYYEYDLAVGDALPCSNNLAKMIEYVDSVLDTKDDAKITELKQQFGMEAITRADDFAAALIDIGAEAVQYGEDDWAQKLCALPLIGEPSSSATQTNTVLDTIRGYKALQKAFMAENEMSFDDYNSDVFTKKQQGSMWSWSYQTCTEYAYWQTAPPKPMRALRSKYINVAYYERLCGLMFGQSVPEHANVDYINRHYLAQNNNMNRIVYVDGEYDPWRRLSLNAPEVKDRPVSQDRPRYIIAKGSHCTDLGAKRASDSASKSQAKAAVDAHIVRWLQTESIHRH